MSIRQQPSDSAGTAPVPTVPARSPSERLLTETLVLLTALAKELGLDVGTVQRWCFRGVLGRPREGVRNRERLEHVQIGGRVYTSREALARHVTALNGTAPAEDNKPQARTPAQRRKALDAADRACGRLGV